MKRFSFLALFVGGISFVSTAQNVGIGTNTPDASAKLQIVDANRGLLIPNVNITNVTSAVPVSAPATGLLVWNTNASVTGGSGVGYYYWNGSKWVRLTHTDDPGEFKSIDGLVQNTTDINNDDFVFGSDTLDSDGIDAHNYRVIFDKDFGAFRAGYSYGDRWDIANRGFTSVAFNYGNIASGNSSAAFGELTTASAVGSVAFGTYTTASNNYATAFGHTTTAGGERSTSFGTDTQALGQNSIAIGASSIASNTNSFAGGNSSLASGANSFSFGTSNTAETINAAVFGSNSSATFSADNALVMGQMCSAYQSNSFAGGFASQANGQTSFAFGDNANAGGTNAIAIGDGAGATQMRSVAINGNATGVNSFGAIGGTAQGDHSLAIGLSTISRTQNEVTLGAEATAYTPTNTSSDRIFTVGLGGFYGVSGDAIVILKNGNTGLGTSTPSARLDVVGSFQYIDGSEGAGKVLTSDANGNATWSNAAGSGEFISTGGVVQNTTDVVNDDFVFGSTQLDDNGIVANDNRFMFDKSSGAFRAGSVTGTAWDSGALGNYSTAFGRNTSASGNASFAVGELSSATASYAVAIGYSNNATALYAFAAGYGSNATGSASIALGGATSSGSNSIGGGFGVITPSYGEAAFGLFNTTYTPGNASGFVATDRIFTVGNGQTAASRSNAMVILKNGNVGLGYDTPNYDLTMAEADGGEIELGNVAFNNANSGAIRFNENVTAAGNCGFEIIHDGAANALIFNRGCTTQAEFLRFNRTGNAANFTGDVLITGNLNITGTISKGAGTFKIDHPLDPENKYLVHSFVESPEMMNVYSGNITTDANGYATVTLPDYFEVANKDFRYQLTVIGSFEQAIIKEKVSGNTFVIQTSAPNVEVSWEVTGVRADKFAEEHRVRPEEEKKFKGSYLHPELYGAPESMSETNARNRANASEGQGNDN